MKRVGVSGIGVLSPCGIDKEAFWRGLESGQSYICHDEYMASLGFKSIVLSRLDDFDICRFNQLSNLPGLAKWNSSAKETGVIFSSAIGGTATVNKIMGGLSQGGMRPWLSTGWLARNSIRQEYLTFLLHCCAIAMA